MFNRLVNLNPGAQIPSSGSLKYLHHEAEKRTRQCGIPPAFGAFVANECMLGLHLQELKKTLYKQPCAPDKEELTETGTLASSSTLRILSLPARGTWVSFK